MAALTAMKSMRQRLAGRQSGLTYEVEVVAQHAAELPLSPGGRAMFVLKRRHRLCVTESAEVDSNGSAEWNTRCTLTATLQKDGQGDAWRPKEFVFKVQELRATRLGQEAATTVAKATLDLSQFCQAEPFGPKQLVLPLQPRGVLHASVRTRWLRGYDAEPDSLTDISHLSLAPSVVTSVAAGSLLQAADSQEREQDLSGFDGGTALGATATAATAATAAGDGGAPGVPIRAVYPAAAAASARTTGTPGQKRRQQLAAALRLPRRGGTARDLLAPSSHQQQHALAQQQQQQQQPGGFQFAAPNAAPQLVAAPLQRSVTAPVGERRPAGATPLLMPPPETHHQADAATPTLIVRTRLQAGEQNQQAHPGLQEQQEQQEQQQQQQGPAQGLPPECWSPINLKEAVERLYDSEEEPTPKASVLATVKRMFGRARNNTPPLPPGTTARQLHETFGTPIPTPPQCTPDPTEIATIDRESSAASLRRRCKRLLVERDEARAEGYAEAALAVEQGLEIDRLRRSKDMLLGRLQVTEAQLLATFRDEAASDLIQALATARVEAAQLEFKVLDLEGQLRRRDAAVDALRARLTRLEARYRASVHELSPGPGAPRPISAWRDPVATPPPASSIRSWQADVSPLSLSAASPAGHRAGGQNVADNVRRDGQGSRAASDSPPVRPLRLHDNPLSAEVEDCLVAA